MPFYQQFVFFKYESPANKSTQYLPGQQRGGSSLALHARWSAAAAPRQKFANSFFRVKEKNRQMTLSIKKMRGYRSMYNLYLVYEKQRTLLKGVIK